MWNPEQNVNHNQDARNRETPMDLNIIDYEWIEKTSKVKDLKLAYESLVIDGCFPDLIKTCGEKICTIDPKFRRHIEGDKPIPEEEKRAIEDDLFDFLDKTNAQDTKLRNEVSQEDQENKSVFSNGQSAKKTNDTYVSPLVEEIQNKKMAETERIKGNEAVKAKEYSVATFHYTNSINLDKTEPFTFANRSMAYLKQKLYANAIQDASEAIKLKPGYLKAHHRRGKALVGIGQYEKAIKDFQYILEEEPENKDVNKDLQDCRVKMNEADKKKSAEPEKVVEGEKKTFKRIAIEEDSDEEEEEDEQEEAVSQPKIQPVNANIKSKFPLKTQRQFDDHSKQSKKLMQSGGDAFMKKYEEYQIVKNAPMKEEKPQVKEVQKPKVEEVSKPKKSAKDIKKEEALKKQQEKALELQNALKEAEEAKAKVQQAEADAKKAEDEKKKVEAEVKVAEKKMKEAEAKIKESQADIQKEMEQIPTMSEADLKKKEKQRPKVDKVITKCETKKSAAAEKFKIGQYGDAVKDYTGAVQVLESAVEDFPLFKQELNQIEATIFNNIAACHKKELNSKLEIEFTTKVVDRQEYITDSSVLLKAYLRRGLAYEQQEKFLQAKEDMLTVKEIMADNKHASQCLGRCQKAIKEIYGNKVPDVKKNKPFKLSSSPSPVRETETKKESPKKEEEEGEKKLSVDQLTTEFARIKDEGNKEFKDKSFLMAASKFTEGISIYKKHIAIVNGVSDLKTKVTNLYTNRSLAMHKLGNQADALADAHYVIENLDSKNAKALFRRAQGYKSQGNILKAVTDLEALSKIEPKNAECKKDLIELKTKLRNQEQENKNKPFIQEVEVKSTPAADLCPPEEKEETSPKKTSPKKAKATKGVDKETVAKASAVATEKANESALKSIPKTSAGMEKDYKQLKSNTQNVYQYLKQIPLKTLENLYKKSEVEAGILAGYIGAMSEHGLNNKESTIHVGEFFCSLSKASNYDMTLMFVNDEEKEKLLQIQQELKQHADKALLDKFVETYGDL